MEIINGGDSSIALGKKGAERIAFSKILQFKKSVLSHQKSRGYHFTYQDTTDGTVVL